MTKNSKKLFIFIICTILVSFAVIFASVLIFYKGDMRVDIATQEFEEESNSDTQSDATKKNSAELNATYSSVFSPKFGNPKAKVSFIMFFDFDCIYCKQQYAALRTLMDTYKDYVYFEFRNMPFDTLHENAFYLANAAMCANAQDKFWEMFDIMYREFDFRSFSNDNVKTIVDSYANEIGLDMNLFNDCYANERYQNVIKKDYVDGLNYGVKATPTIFINGQRISGVISKENLEKLFKLSTIEK